MPTVPPPPESSPEEAVEPPRPTSALLRFGALLGAAALAAALAAAPPALRVASELVDGPSRGSVWLGVTAALVAPMLLAVAVLRGARVGLRAFEGPGRGRRLAAVVLWTVLFAGWLVVFGAALRATTHHHALAGATFAVVSVVAGAGLALVARRLARVVFAQAPGARAALVALIGSGLALGALLVAARLGRGPTEPSGLQASELFLDGLAFAMAALFVSRPELGQRRAVALIGPPVAAVVLVAGLSVLRGAPPLVAALEAHAPAYAPIFRMLAEH